MNVSSRELLARDVLRCCYPHIKSVEDFEVEFAGKGLVEGRGTLCFLWDELLRVPLYVIREPNCLPRTFEITPQPDSSSLSNMEGVVRNKGRDEEDYGKCRWFPSGVVTPARVKVALEVLRKTTQLTNMESKGAWEAVIAKRLNKKGSISIDGLTFTQSRECKGMSVRGLKVSTQFFSFHICCNEACYEQGARMLTGEALCELHIYNTQVDTAVSLHRRTIPLLFNVFGNLMKGESSHRSPEMGMEPNNHEQWNRFIRKLFTARCNSNGAQQVQHICGGFRSEFAFETGGQTGLVFRSCADRRKDTRFQICLYPHCLARIIKWRERSETLRPTDPLKRAYCDVHQGADNLLTMADIL